MARLSGLAVHVDLPPGWDGRIYRRTSDEPGVGAADAMRTVASSHAVLHAGSFPLPADRGDYGSGAVEVMRREDVLVMLVEHGPASADTALFATPGPPRRLSSDDFSPSALLRAIPGQGGTQVFFSAKGRAFCLYVVLGDYEQRDRAVPVVNSLLQSVRLGTS
jgi:hypothetical protein